MKARTNKPLVVVPPLKQLCDLTRMRSLQDEIATRGEELSKCAVQFKEQLDKLEQELGSVLIPASVPRLPQLEYKHVRYYEVTLPPFSNRYGVRHLTIAFYPHATRPDVLRIGSVIVQTPDVKDEKMHFFYAIEDLAVEHITIADPIHAKVRREMNTDPSAIDEGLYPRVQIEYCLGHVAPEVEVLVPNQARSWRLEVGSSISADLIFSRAEKWEIEDADRNQM